MVTDAQDKDLPGKNLLDQDVPEISEEGERLSGICLLKTTNRKVKAANRFPAAFDRVTMQLNTIVKINRPHRSNDLKADPRGGPQRKVLNLI